MAATARPKAASKARRGPTRRKSRPRAKRKWSAKVMQKSDALDLKSRLFTWRDPKRIARSLKQSAAHRHCRKAGPYQSAMSMLNFYLNRGGRNVPAERKRVLRRAKTELRRLFGRE